MPLPRGILSLMKDTISAQPRANDDAYGTKTYGASVSVRARVMYDQKRIWAADGTQTYSTTQVIAEDVPTLTADGKITLPDGTSPPIRSIKHPSWPDGSKHMEIYL
jgi:hypothetical protein